jgi:hypothetical protein
MAVYYSRMQDARCGAQDLRIACILSTFVYFVVSKKDFVTGYGLIDQHSVLLSDER